MPHPSPSSPAAAPFAERRRSRGATLIEMVIAITIISVAITGVMVLFNNSVRNSGNAVASKQALAIAEAMLNEVLAQPFTYCDPQDLRNDPTSPPTSTATCTGGVGGSQDTGGLLGPQPATESRFSATDPFDNVADYNGYAMNNNIYSIDGGGAAIPALAGYSATVTVARDTGPTQFGQPVGDVLRVTVRVTFRNGIEASLTGYRFRYAPTSTS